MGHFTELWEPSEWTIGMLERTRKFVDQKISKEMNAARRVRMYFLPIDFALSMLRIQRGSCPRFLQLYKDNLPDNAKVQSVHLDYSRRAFGVVVESPDFDDVPDGAMMPEVNGWLKYEVVDLDADERNRALKQKISDLQAAFESIGSVTEP